MSDIDCEILSSRLPVSLIGEPFELQISNNRVLFVEPISEEDVLELVDEDTNLDEWRTLFLVGVGHGEERVRFNILIDENLTALAAKDYGTQIDLNEAVSFLN